ncbi:MAG TPA: bifunctional oligoribonuclease/PAP phosphatase NrnA [Nitrospirota bacterium]|nr:bifunctional oligoribonuclease/PAP phosphatase NrnA [Nitrospirota bacterium]
MSDLAAVAAALQPVRTALISVHKNPDGDALGAQLALLLALEKIGKSATAHNLDPVPEIYRFLPHAHRIKTGPVVEGRYDACIVLDAEPARTALFDLAVPAELLINIDHHITNPVVWPITWLDPDAAATGVMIYKLLQRLGVEMDRDIAMCLYTSIFTDTGSFRYSNTSPESMRIAADLLDAGADPWLVTENVYESLAFKRLRLLGSILAEMERTSDGRVAWVVVTDELYRATQTRAEDTDNFVNFVRSAKGVEVAVLFRQTGAAEYKISLRSKGRVDLSGFARSLGGGGHKNAAGAVMKGSLEDVRSKVVGEVSRTVEQQLGKGAIPLA